MPTTPQSPSIPSREEVNYWAKHIRNHGHGKAATMLEALSADHARLQNESADVFVNHVAAMKLLGDEIENLKAERDRLTAQLSAQSGEVERVQVNKLEK